MSTCARRRHKSDEILLGYGKIEAAKLPKVDRLVDMSLTPAMKTSNEEASMKNHITGQEGFFATLFFCFVFLCRL